MKLTRGFAREYYDRTCMWSEGYWNESELERARKTVALLPNDASSVLDVGCGAGIVTQMLKSRFSWVAGLDFAFEPLRQVKGFQIHTIQGNACTLPFRDKMFGAVISAEVIEHLSETVRCRVLGEMMRVTRKYILITVPYREVLEAGQVKCRECGCKFSASHHMKSFSETDMSLLLNPRFRLMNIKTFGPIRKRMPCPLIMFAQAFGGYARVRPGLRMCPQCGNTEHYVSNTIPRLFLGVCRRILPLPKYRSWMAALYENQDNL